MVARKRDRKVRVGITLRVHKIIHAEVALDTEDHATIEAVAERIRAMEHIDIGTFNCDGLGDVEVTVQDGRTKLVGVELLNEWSKMEEC